MIYAVTVPFPPLLAACCIVSIGLEIHRHVDVFKLRHTTNDEELKFISNESGKVCGARVSSFRVKKQDPNRITNLH